MSLRRRSARRVNIQRMMLALVACGSCAQAQTWDGGSVVDSSWTTAANWNPNAAPANDGSANVVFDGTTRLTPTVNTVQAIKSLAFGKNAGAFVIGGTSTLTISVGITNDDAGTQTINAPILFSASQSISAAAGSLVFGGPTTITNVSTLTITGAFSTTMTGGINGNGGVSKTGASTFRLGGTNTYSGNTTVAQGILQLQASNVLPNNSLLNVSGVSATVDFNGFSNSLANITGFGTIALGDGSLTSGGAGGSVEFAGNLTGISASQFLKVGTGTMQLTGSIGSVGQIFVPQGTLQLGLSERIANSASVTVNGGRLSLPGVSETFSQALLSAGTITGGDLSVSTLEIQNGVFETALHGSSTLRKTTSGTGTLSAPGSNFSGPTFVQTGTLVVANTAMSPNTDVDIAVGATLRGLGNLTFDGLTGNGALVSISSLSFLTLGANNGGGTFGGTIDGSGLLRKFGTGSQTLSGLVAPNGAIEIDAGTLALGASERLPDGVEVDMVGGALFGNSTETIGILDLEAGSIAGSGTLVVNDLMTLHSGTVAQHLAGTVSLLCAEGSVTLSNSNFYTGVTSLAADGTLNITSSANLGNATINFDGGFLRTNASMTLTQPMTGNPDIGGIDTQFTTTVMGSASFVGGTFAKAGPGTLIFPQGTPSFIDLLVSAGELWFNGSAAPVVQSNLFVTAGAKVRVDGVSFTCGGINNLGEVELRNGALLRAGGIGLFNIGLFHGDGSYRGVLSNTGELRVDSGKSLYLESVDNHNTGRITLLGGSLDLSGVFNNSANVSGRGTLIATDYENDGTITLSAGISDVFGTVTNSPGGKVIVTGGATATFYNAVGNGPGSEFRVSAGSTAVFLAPVTGNSAFTGSGLKIFESTSSVGALFTTGDSLVDAGASLTAASIRENALEVDGVATIPANGTNTGASRLNTLTIGGSTNNWTGKLDLTDNDLIVDYTGASPLDTMRNQLKTGYAIGNWNGNGITSNSANAAHSGAHPTALGFAEASALNLSTFDAQTVDNTALLVRYTYTGDANLDGLVNALDFNALATNFGGASGRLWTEGDFNYDGATNTLDFNALASNFNQPAFPSPPLGSLVPEPSSLALATMLLLLPRRRAR